MVDKNARLEYLDLFRGFGIIFMVMGHIGFGKMFDFWIHAFHMPMFFFVSGFLYKKPQNIKNSICKKANTLLTPYVCFGVIHSVIWIAMGNRNIRPVINLFYQNTVSLPIAGALWFLTSLFFTYVVYMHIDLIKNKLLKYGLLLLCVVAGMGFPQWLPVRLPLAIDTALVGVGLFHAGHLFAKINKPKKSLSIWYPLLLLWGGVIVSIAIFKNGYINLRTGTYSCWLLFWINAIGATVIGLQICKEIAFFSRCSPILQRMIAPIVYIGKTSITYVCCNQIVISFLNKAISTMFPSSSTTQILLAHSATLILTLLVLYCIDQVLQRTKLRLLIGREQ